MDQAHQQAESGSVMAQFRESVSDDLRLLAHLHDVEPQATTLEALRGQPLQKFLGLKLTSPLGRDALEIFDGALEELPPTIGGDLIDAFGAEYGDIYLTYAHRASPSESVWFDDDGLERQEAMFQVRSWYRKYGIVTSDPGNRPDDHLVFQLLFIAQLIARDEKDDGLREACRFMDDHLLRWLGQFCGRAASRCRYRYFAGLLLVTAAYLEDLRDLLAEALDEPRSEREKTEKGLRRKSSTCGSAPASFLPGTGPGW